MTDDMKLERLVGGGKYPDVVAKLAESVSLMGINADTYTTEKIEGLCVIYTIICIIYIICVFYLLCFLPPSISCLVHP